MEGVQGKTRDVLPCRGLEGTLGVTSWGLGVGSEQKDRDDGWKSRFQGLGKLEGGDTSLNFSILRRGRGGTAFAWKGLSGLPILAGNVPHTHTICRGEDPQGQEVRDSG